MTPRAVRWTHAATRDLEELQEGDRDLVLAKVREFAATNQGDVKRLRGTKGEYRLRAGNYRARFTLPAGAVLVLRVLPRSEAYRR